MRKVQRVLAIGAVWAILLGAPRAAVSQDDASPPTAPSNGAADADQPPGTAGVDRAPPHQPTTLDTSQGASAPPGQERGWAEEPGMEPEDGVLLLPRVVLAVPRYLFAGLFWPLRGLLEVIDGGTFVARVERVLYWNDEQTIGWFPIVTFLSRDGFTAGLRVFHSDLLGHGERLEASGRFGGRYTQAYELSFDADRLAGTRVWLEVRGRYEASPSLLFQGVNAPRTNDCGPPLRAPTQTACPTYFRQERVLGLLRSGFTFGGRGEQLQVGGTAVVNHRLFGPDQRDERSLETVYQSAEVVAFDAGATTLELDANVLLDGREGAGLAGSGVYFELFGGYAVPLEDYSYWHYGAELAVTLDLFRGNRLLTARTFIESVHAEDDEIPFTDLPRLGGPDRLRGYEPGQLRGEVAALASLEYHYPIHKNLAGVLFVDTGFVGGTYADVFGDFERWRVGGGGGLLFGSADSLALRLDFSVGDGFHFFFSTDLAHAFTDRSEQL